jgi:outer membrane autotransporter protein
MRGLTPEVALVANAPQAFAKRPWLQPIRLTVAHHRRTTGPVMCAGGRGRVDRQKGCLFRHSKVTHYSLSIWVRGTLVAAAVMLSAFWAGTALANGGDGGDGDEQGATGGAGAGGFTGEQGGRGGNSFANIGGGGGGGGAGGGRGGDGNFSETSPIVCGTGGAGGTVTSPNGETGKDSCGETTSAGGGGGGFNGNGSGASTIHNTGTLIGGNGGNGGSMLGGSAGGGGGGAGGFGAVVTGGGFSSNSGTIMGGDGGRGGRVIGHAGAHPHGGDGGDGGEGVRFTAPGAIFSNTGTVKGGNGGAGGDGALGGISGRPGAGGAGIVGSDLNIINGGTIEGGLSGDGTTRANAITFTGGTNTLMLSASSDIIGNVVAGGAVESLSLTGTTTAQFIINGGTFGGTGTMGGLTVTNGGTVAPGDSIGTKAGTMTVNGNLRLNPGAVYEVQGVNAQGQSDKVIVTGTVNLTGATLRVLAANGNYQPETDYVIIENKGNDLVNGKFAQVTANLAFLTPSVKYNVLDPNPDVVLTLTRTSAFASVAQTRNHRTVAGALDQSPTGQPLFLGVLNQTVGGALQAFDALSGELHATVAGMLADDSRYVREAILGRLMQASYTNSNGQVASLGAAGPQVASLNGQAMALGYDDKSLAPSPSASSGLTFWTGAFGAWANFDGDKNAASANRNLGGFVSGMDARLTGSWRVGLAAGYSQSNLEVDNRYSSAEVNSFHLGGYGGGMAGPLALRGGGTWTWNNIDTSRAVIFPSFFEREKASYNPGTGQLFGELAYPTAMWGMGLEPFAGLAYVSINGDNFRERGGTLAALAGHGTDENVGYSTVGLRAAQTMHWEGMLVTPHVSGAWQHAFDDVTPDAALTFASTGIGFTVYGVPLAQDTALVDAGFDLALAPNATAGVSYSGQFGDRVQDNAVKGRFTWLF